MASLILFNKPYQVLSQFTDKQGRRTLANYIDRKNVYAAGRLDYDSEGLLLLTDSGELQHHISHPKHKQPKTYWVQVDGERNQKALEQLRMGVELKDGLTLPAKVKVIERPNLWERNPPIRKRRNNPTHWLKVTITEGRNRQVRRMTAAVGLPTLRLIRASIGNWSLGNLEPGKHIVETIHTSINRPSSHKTQREKNSPKAEFTND